MNEKLEYAYWAGVIDYKAILCCATATIKDKKYIYPILRIQKAKRHLLKSLHDTFGGHVFRKPKTTPVKGTLWYWQLKGKPLYDLLERCLPYLKLKKEHAKVILEFEDVPSTERQEMAERLRELNHPAPQ